MPTSAWGLSSSCAFSHAERPHGVTMPVVAAQRVHGCNAASKSHFTQSILKYSDFLLEITAGTSHFSRFMHLQPVPRCGDRLGNGLGKTLRSSLRVFVK